MLRYGCLMRIISNRALREFALIHPDSSLPLPGWRRVIEANSFDNWASLKRAFNNVDRVGELAVFDIAGNRYRLVAYVRFERQIVYVKSVMTHSECEKGRWKP